MSDAEYKQLAANLKANNNNNNNSNQDLGENEEESDSDSDGAESGTVVIRQNTFIIKEDSEESENRGSNTVIYKG
jgi:hypothetical protein